MEGGKGGAGNGISGGPIIKSLVFLPTGQELVALGSAVGPGRNKSHQIYLIFFLTRVTSWTVR